jgi:hypothetical protein
LLKADVGFSPAELIPHPINTEGIAIGYLLRGAHGNTPITSQLFHPQSSITNCDVTSSLFVLPSQLRTIEYPSLFRVAVVSFMDIFNYSSELAPFAAVGFITPEGASIGLDQYYMRSDVENILSDPFYGGIVQQESVLS